MKLIVFKMLFSLYVLLGLVMPNLLWAANDANLKLDKVDISLDDKASLQNGAGLFLNYCVACHGAKFMRFSRVQEDLEIPEEIMQKYWITGDRQIGDTMTTTLTAQDGETWFGIAPPDLSLIGRLREPEWIYTYLRSFYRDPSTQSGWNNAVFTNSAMPHAMMHLQGIQEPVYKTVTLSNGESSRQIERLVLSQTGSMNPEEFDIAMRDLTRFLVYVGEPAKLVRYNYGVWVIAFLIIFAFFAYFLKKEYWRDVHE